jgi:hypothetical protein
VAKKLKAGDGKARTMATAKGIADEHILKNDTILCPVSQFSFPAATTKKKFGGNNEFLLSTASSPTPRSRPPTSNS